MTRTTLVAVSMYLACACQASASGRLEAKSSGDGDATVDAQGTTEQKARREAEQLTPPDRDLAPASESPVSSTADAMLGARPGLRPKDPVSAGTPCKCLSVVLGHPTDPGFAWEGPITRTNPNTQLAIGLTSDGLACPEAASDSLGASYRGYEMSGSDVIVEVETARLGRPVTRGAIIPRPSMGNRVIVRAADPKSPYGRSPDGRAADCVVWTAR